MATVIKPISDGNVSNKPLFSSSPIRLVWATGQDEPGSVHQCSVWLRFRIPVVSGFTIPSGCLLKLWSYYTVDDYDPNYGLFPPFFVGAFNEDNAAIPVSYADYVSRPVAANQRVTTSSVLGDIAPGPDTYSAWQYDVSSQIQAVVNRAGYSGNVIIALQVDASYTDPTNDSPMVAQSMQNAINGSTYQPRLTLPFNLAGSHNKKRLRPR
jgi:hypothetical protein